MKKSNLSFGDIYFYRNKNEVSLTHIPKKEELSSVKEKIESGELGKVYDEKNFEWQAISLIAPPLSPIHGFSELRNDRIEESDKIHANRFLNIFEDQQKTSMPFISAYSPCEKEAGEISSFWLCSERNSHEHEHLKVVTLQGETINVPVKKMINIVLRRDEKLISQYGDLPEFYEYKVRFAMILKVNETEFEWMPFGREYCYSPVIDRQFGSINYPVFNIPLGLSNGSYIRMLKELINSGSKVSYGEKLHYNEEFSEFQKEYNHAIQWDAKRKEELASYAVHNFGVDLNGLAKRWDLDPNAFEFIMLDDFDLFGWDDDKIPYAS